MQVEIKKKTFSCGQVTCQKFSPIGGGPETKLYIFWPNFFSVTNHYWNATEKFFFKFLLKSYSSTNKVHRRAMLTPLKKSWYISVAHNQFHNIRSRMFRMLTISKFPSQFASTDRKRNNRGIYITFVEKIGKDKDKVHSTLSLYNVGRNNWQRSSP